ncbi:MAG: AsmA-like C-terminal region-containing protein [Cyclobacteriaceae bacterium]|nr:AsmA-like C-terminal region-containing protein [Cyclobacteriaceae bacterium]
MRLAKKILISFLIILVSAIMVFAVAYNLLQSKIQFNTETLVNKTIAGSIKIGGFSYSFFSTYPKIIIDIDTLVLSEAATDEWEGKNVFKIYGLHIQLDVSKVRGGLYLIDEFKLAGGAINLITYNDSSINLLNAVALISPDLSNNEGKPLNLELRNILLENIQIAYTNQLTNQYTSSNLNKLSSALKIKGDSLTANLDFTYVLDSLVIENKRIVNRHELSFASNVNVNLLSNNLQITNGLISLNLLKANINGSYNGADNGFVDFKIWAKHTDLAELAKMDIFRKENLPEIKHGEFEIDAKIIGYTVGQVPLIEATASLKNLEVYNRFGKVIDRAGFNLSFRSLSSKNFSDSHFKVNSISVKLTSGGYFRARAQVDHINKPKFNITWEASEQLENIDKLVNIPQVGTISGGLVTKGSYGGVYHIKSQIISNYSGNFSISFDNVNLVLDKGNYPINNINGTAYMSNGDIGLENLRLTANTNKMLLNGKVENALPFVFGKPTQLTASFAVKSDIIATESLLAFNKTLSDSNKYIIREVDVSLRAELASNALDNFTLIPTGKLTVYNFTALIEGAPSIAEFKGVVEANQKLVALKNFKGVIGKSHVDFSVSVSNYADYLQSDTEKQMVVDLSLKSEQINVKDFFTINQKFVLPKSYEQEVLKDVAANTKIITTNFELQKKGLVPEFELQVTGLQFRTLYTPVIFKDIFVFGLVKNNNVYVNSMFGKFGRSDVFMNAEFDNVVATKDTISRPLVSRVTFNSGVLDLNELIKLDDAEKGKAATLEQEVASNPFADNFPITEFQLNIGELNYYDATIREISGLIKIEENNLVHLHEVKLKSGAYGTFEFDGDLDASSHKEAILKSTIKISDVDLSKLNVTYIQNNEEVKISDHFEGIINGKIVANVPILQDFSFDLARLTGKVKVKMTNGALLNYAPLKEMGSYFKNKDLTRVRFDTLKNIVIFNAGKILLPFMTINTTLGTINLMGFQDLENNMEYDIQVPIKLVAGSALNSLFASKKGDDKKGDKIRKGGKGKYVTVHISGNNDQYKFKLGKKHVLTAPPGFKVD